jgi:hypothetical protein
VFKPALALPNSDRGAVLRGEFRHPAIFAQSAPLVQDSYVVPGSASNYGAAATLNVGGVEPRGAGAVRSDAITRRNDIRQLSKATLILFVTKLNAAGTVNFSTANGAWTESGVNGASGTPVPLAAVAGGVAI